MGSRVKGRNRGKRFTSAVKLERIKLSTGEYPPRKITSSVNFFSAKYFALLRNRMIVMSAAVITAVAMVTM